MDKNKAINIGQRVFLFNLDAFEKFSLYHKMIKDHFNRYSDSEKKLEDIEFKLADLFDLQLNGKESLSFADVEIVIDKVGFSSDWDQTYDTESTTNLNRSNRLYRSSNDSVIAGICGGLAEYFKTEAVYIRIATVLIALLLAVVPVVCIYLIVWFIVPTEAELSTRATVKPDNTSLKKASQKSSAFFTKFMGIIILIISALMIIGIYFALSYAYYSLDLNLINVNLIDNASQDFLVTSFIIVVMGPFILLLMLGIRMLKNSPYPKYTWLSSLLIWFACLLSTVFYTQKMFHEFSEEAAIKDLIVMQEFAEGVLVINTEFTKNEDDIDFLLPEIILTSKSTDKVTIKMQFIAVGQNREVAKDNAKMIVYEPQIHGNIINLPSKIDISKNPYFRFQEVKLWIDIPYDLEVEINNFNRYRFNIKNPRGSRFEKEHLPKFVDQVRFESTKKGLIIIK